jgi:DegV family protein with EDD domain
VGKVKVVADSCCDIPQELVESLDIEMVPLNVHFGTDVYKDCTELSSEEFFKKLVSDPRHPRTSQPSPGEFSAVYRKALDEGRPVVSVHISADLSGTYQSAVIASGDFPGAEIEVVDTRLASMAEGLSVLEAARAAKEGRSFQEVAAVARRAAANSGVFFVVDTLDYLHRNGRIGKAAHLIGSLLNMKPILSLEAGVVVPVEKVRGKNKALSTLKGLVVEKVGAKRVKLSVIHGNAPDVASQMASELATAVHAVEVITAPLGAVIGTHGGPGLVGAAYLLVE